MAVFWSQIGRGYIVNNFDFVSFSNSVEEDSLAVLKGLDSKTQKTIDSKYFYDEKGSILFDKITKLDDYYPTKTECEILEKNEDKISKRLPSNSVVIEFGSGSNQKIKKLLKAINNPTEYIPIDISKEFLLKNAKKSAKDFPDLKIKAVCADFDQTDLLQKTIDSNKSKIGFFPGSTIGNYSPEDAKKLLINFSRILGKQNFLVIGVDLKKDIEVLEKAYNDSKGLTAEFNKNILNGVNKIFGPIFDSNLFSHKAFFNKKKSRIEMHLVSKKKQVVNVLNTEILFKEGETIHTENSYKYSVTSFQNLAESSNFEMIDILQDKKSFFGVFIMKVKDI